MATSRNVVAIVDDDPEIRQALESMLSAFGYRTELYASAEEFVRAAITSEADCLLVDIQLGDLSGGEIGSPPFSDWLCVSHHIHDGV